MALTLAQIQIGWISALPIEALLAEVMLDELIEQTITLPPNDNNIYTYGRIKIKGNDASHIVAIAQLPLSTPGKSSTATVANNMRRTFPNLKFGIMVGIAGGIWTPEEDLRLGDVVVGVPDDGRPGVIQYDHGKAIQEHEFILRGSSNKAPDVLRTAVGLLKRKHMRRPGDYVSTLNNDEVKRLAPRPSVDSLFSPTYIHQGGHTCGDCDTAHLRDRFHRVDSTPRVHYGAIASGDQVIKDANLAEKIRETHNIMCFEMEAAGLDVLPCLVVRGISDYADTHKNDEWHAYAAATAAAYAKELLAVVPLTAVEELLSTGNTHWNVPRAPNSLFTGRQALLNNMKKHLIPGSKNNDRPVFVLQGIGGAGKSEAAIKFATENQDSFWGIFWIDADNKQSVEQGFAEVAKMQTPPLLDTTSRGVLRWLANIKEPWLLILDNCDDSMMDFAAYMPSRGGSIILTTRLTECKDFGAWANLDDLGSDAAMQLLLGACGYESSNQEAHTPAAEEVVTSLGQHALALVHAGAYIKKGLCTLDEYVYCLRKEQARLMKFKPKQQASRYGSVYATFEVSAEALASSGDHDCEIALRLLNILAFLNREAVEEDIFSRAFDECYKLEKDWEKNGMQCPKCPADSVEHDRVTKRQSEIDTPGFSGDDTHIASGWNERCEISKNQPQGPSRAGASHSQEITSKQRTCLTNISNDKNNGLSGTYIREDRDNMGDCNDDATSQIDHLHIWHCEKVRSSGLIQRQMITRFRIARTRLADLSLIRVDDNRISMHPLVHEWARTRLEKTARTIAWEQSVSVLALSAIDLYWYSFTPRLAPHIDTCFHSRGQETSQSWLSLTVVQALYRLAWHLYEDSRYQSSLFIFETLSLSFEVQPHTNPLANHDCMIGTSSCLVSLGRHEQAQDLVNHMVQSIEMRYGTISSNAFEWQVRLAELYNEVGDYQGAINLFEPLYERYAQGSILKDLQMECLFENLVLVHKNLGNDEQALIFAEKNFQSCRTHLPDSTRRLQALAMLCVLYIDGHAKKAVTMLEDIIKLFCKTSSPNPRWVWIMMLLAEAYVELNRPNEAIPHLAEASSQLAKLLADNVPAIWLADMMGQLADIYLDLGETSVAATMLGGQVILKAPYLSLHDKRRFSTLRKLARVYIRFEDIERLEKAVELLGEVVDYGHKTFRADVKDLEHSKQLLAEAQWKLTQATRTQRSVLDVRDQQSSQEETASNHPASTVARDIANLPQRRLLCAEVADSHKDQSSGREKELKAVLGDRTKLSNPVVSGTSMPKLTGSSATETTRNPGYLGYLRRLRLVIELESCARKLKSSKIAHVSRHKQEPQGYQFDC